MTHLIECYFQHTNPETGEIGACVYWIDGTFCNLSLNLYFPAHFWGSI